MLILSSLYVNHDLLELVNKVTHYENLHKLPDFWPNSTASASLLEIERALQDCVERVCR